MNAIVENTSNLGRRISITIPAEVIRSSLTERLHNIAPKVEMPGFRKNKVPFKVIEERYTQDVFPEIIEKQVTESLREVLKEHQLTPVMRPMVDSLKADIGSPLQFTAVFDIFPTFDLVDFGKVKVEKIDIAITDQDLDDNIKNFQDYFSAHREVERPAKMGDRLVVDFSATVPVEIPQPIQGENLSVKLGSKGFIEGFEAGLVGSMPGEERILNLKFPEGYFDKTLAGQPATFTIKVKDVFQIIPAEINEEFLKKMGAESIEELRVKTREMMETIANNLQMRALKQSVFQQLVELHDFELPKSLVEEKFKQVHKEQHQHEHHSGQMHEDDDNNGEEAGMNTDIAAHNHSPEELAKWRKMSEELAKMELVLEKIIKDQHMKPEPDRVLSHLKEMGLMTGNFEDPQELMKKIDLREGSPLINGVLEAQVVDFILAKADVTTKTMSYHDATTRQQD